MTKTMRKWRLVGYANVDVSISVEAETLEEAIDMASSEVTMTEYCNGTVGVDYWSADRISDGDTCCGSEIEWQEEWCELEEEWEEEDFEEEDDDEENE